MKNFLFFTLSLLAFVACEKEQLAPQESKPQVPELSNADIFIEYLDAIGYFEENADDFGYATFRVFTNENGEADFKVLEAGETTKPVYVTERDDCVAGNGIEYSDCDDFGTGALAKISLGNFISDATENCPDCFETRTERLPNGRYQVYVRCCP